VNQWILGVLGSSPGRSFWYRNSLFHRFDQVGSERETDSIESEEIPVGGDLGGLVSESVISENLGSPKFIGFSLSSQCHLAA